jgi:diaminohydroxyphosphoribosylaminopyrimidine deaminase/5-amino-6-(5-phosphoribosylamino)uracil reductase
MRDPDPRTAGRGLARLRRAGVEVVVGIEEEACQTLNQGFLSRVVRSRPYTHLKLASTVDGRIATRRGDSRWITGEAARAYVHRLRRRVDAIAVGSGTVVVDDPELTARVGGRTQHSPVPVVVDSRLRTPVGARLLRPGHPNGPLLLAGPEAPAARRRRLERAGARVVPVRLREGRIDLKAAWRALGRVGTNEILVEGGGGLAAALLRAGLVDELHLFLAPRLIGGDGRAVLGSLGVERLRGALDLPPLKVRRVGRDLLLHARW